MSLKPILNLATALAALGFVVLGVAATAPTPVRPVASAERSVSPFGAHGDLARQLATR